MPSSEDLYDKAVDLFAEGLYDEAIDAYKQALEIDDTFVDALHGLALAYAEKGDLPSAIATAKRITETAPDDPLGFTSLSMFHQRLGQVPEAEAAASQARVLEWKQALKKT